MEINIAALRENADHSNKTVKDQILLLCDTSMFISSFLLAKPPTFSLRLQHLVKLGLSIYDDIENLPPLKGDDDDEGASAMESVH
mmetsp:Transcript_16390/g.24330  ORF Transcript_16390/g.24330 Transcript_16390/m.24330 type:complete len:85 (+) Transcript_16390:1-255(+)